MNAEENQELGPIDYILIEWPDRQPNGEMAPELLKLVEGGIIRILDLAFMAKAEDGSVAAIEIADLGDELDILVEASTGILDDGDLSEAGEALEPGTSAALLVYENSWASGVASAARRSGGQMVASGRIPHEDLMAALEAADELENDSQ